MRRARVHLAGCAECGARLAEMERRAALAGEWIAQLPADLPDQGKRAVALAAVERARFRRSASGPLGNRVYLRAAAVVAVLLAGTMATQPGRAFVGGAVAAVAHGLGLAGEEQVVIGDVSLPVRR